MPSAPSVAAFVLTYDRKELLASCLDGLLLQTRPPDEIIVVDNGSSDGTQDFVTTAFPQITLLRIDRNRGWGPGFESGLENAYTRGYEYVWCFDDDDRPEPDALAMLLDALETLRPTRVGIIGSWNLAANGGRVIEGELWRHGRRLRAQGVNDDDPYPVDSLSFSGTLISRRVLGAIGYPRKDYFLSFEDIDFCLRAKQAGFEVYVVPKPLTNMLRAGAGADAPWRGYFQTRNHLAFVIERRSGIELWWWLVRTGKLCFATLLWRDRKEERIRMRLLGAWHGIRGVRGRAITLRP